MYVIKREVNKMLVLVIVAIVIAVVMIGLYAYCIGKDIAETLINKKYEKIVQQRWLEERKQREENK